MTTGTQSSLAQTTLDAWTLLSPVAYPLTGVLAFTARHQDGRQGTLRMLDATLAGPDSGALTLEVISAVTRAAHDQLVKPLAAGRGQYGGREVIYAVNPVAQGPSLEELSVDGNALLPAEALGLIARAAQALAVAHDAGVVHGNLAAHALLLLPARAMAVTDFGWAAWAVGASAPQRVLPAPELMGDGPGTAAGDVYALALVAVGLCCGKEAEQHVLEAPPAARPSLAESALESTSKVPPDAVRILLEALAVAPAHRPTAHQLATQLAPHGVELPEIAHGRTPDPDAVAQVNGRVDAWLGEASDPRRAVGGIHATSLEPMPPPDAHNPFTSRSSAELNVSESAIVAASPVTTPPPSVLPPLQDNATLPPPPSAFLSESPRPVVPPVPAATQRPAPAVLVPPNPSPVLINLTTLPLRLGNNGDFPVVVRWTESKGPRNEPGPVEIVKPRASPSGGPVSTRPNLKWLVVALALGVLLGTVITRSGGAPRVEGGAGSLRVESSLAEGDVEITAELDGRALGKLPKEADRVSAGHHVVVLRADGAEPTVIPVVVENGKRALVRGAPEFLEARLMVTASHGGVSVTREDGKAVTLPAEYEDVEPDSDMKLTFLVQGQPVVRTVHVGLGDTHFHLELMVRTEREFVEVPPPPTPPQRVPGRVRPSAAPSPAHKEAPAAVGAEPVAPAVGATPNTKQVAQEVWNEGNSALFAGDFDRALTLANRALSLDPQLADAVKGLGIIHGRRGENCAALKAYKRYLDLQPKGVNVDRVRTIIKGFEVKAPDCQ